MFVRTHAMTWVTAKNTVKVFDIECMCLFTYFWTFSQNPFHLSTFETGGNTRYR